MSDRPQHHPHKGVTDNKTARKSNGQKKTSTFRLLVELTSPNKTGRRAMVHELKEATAPAKAAAIKTCNNDPLKRIF